MKVLKAEKEEKATYQGGDREAGLTNVGPSNESSCFEMVMCV